MTASNWTNRQVDAGRLIDYLIGLPPEPVPMTGYQQVCMNPERPCEECVFSEAHLSRYCLLSERQAKRAYDLQRTEVAA
jgi:hypothetical protein